LNQLVNFAKFASEKGGSITYITMTRVPPQIRDKVIQTLAKTPGLSQVRVSFISLTPF